LDRNAHELARPLVTSSGLRVAVIGGGWAGIAAAVQAVQRGHLVTLLEMSSQLGGRARGLEVAGLTLDNGQHILIGAYLETLGLMRQLGVDLEAVFLRKSLRVIDAQGNGLRLHSGSPVLAFSAAVLRRSDWRLSERVALLATAARWGVCGFRCDPALTVAALTAQMPSSVREQFIDPLCIAALNTPSAEASANVFLRVLKDALFSGEGSSDLLLPRASLNALLPGPALAWLRNHGVDVRLRQRIESLGVAPPWVLDGEPFDRVVIATTPTEASRLVQPVKPLWSQSAARLRYEPIITVYMHSPATRLPEAMLVLRSDEICPAQFVFDRGQLGGPAGLLAFVISGAQLWVDKGMDVTCQAVLDQACQALQAYLGGPLSIVQSFTEKRATFRCTPGLQRPAMRITEGLHAAGDYVEGPYPATLEGAVRSGMQAVKELN
jgi:hydroxysqualene dehydroxylase